MKLENADDRFFERIAKVSASRQPNLFHAVVGAMNEPLDDPDDRPATYLTPEEQGALFITLKTVIDVLDDAVAKQQSAGR